MKRRSAALKRWTSTTRAQGATIKMCASAARGQGQATRRQAVHMQRLAGQHSDTC